MVAPLEGLQSKCHKVAQLWNRENDLARAVSITESSLTEGAESVVMHSAAEPKESRVCLVKQAGSYVTVSTHGRALLW